MGITFKASSAIDMTAINFSNLFYGLPMTATSKKYVLQYDNGFTDTFQGEGFKYADNGIPKGGTVESFAESQYSAKLFAITHMEVSVKAIVKAASTVSQDDDVALIIKVMAGKDHVMGSNGSDLLYAGGGDDTIDGKGGNDLIVSGPGADKMTGGLGADTFYFAFWAHSPNTKGRDTITDFVGGLDVIDVSAIGATSFIGDTAFSGGAGEVRAQASGANTLVLADLDGNGTADFSISLKGAVSLTELDFAF